MEKQAIKWEKLFGNTCNPEKISIQECMNNCSDLQGTKHKTETKHAENL